jgi:hypothetical protein
VVATASTESCYGSLESATSQSCDDTRPAERVERWSLARSVAVRRLRKGVGT